MIARNIFKGLEVDGTVTAVYDDYFVTITKGPDGKSYSVTVTNAVWEKQNPVAPLPKSRDVVSLGKIRLLDGKRYRAYQAQPKS